MPERRDRHDLVRLLTDRFLATHDIAAGTLGYVTETQGEDAFEVEVLGPDGSRVALVDCRRSELEVAP